MIGCLSLGKWQKVWGFNPHLVFHMSHRYVIGFCAMIIPSYQATFKIPEKALTDNSHIDLETLEPCMFCITIFNLFYLIILKSLRADNLNSLMDFSQNSLKNAV